MGEFRVRPGALREAVADAHGAGVVLDDLRDATGELAGRMRDEPALQRAVGSHHIDEFATRWSKEFDLIRQMITAMDGLLLKAAAAYEDTDVDLAAQLTALGGGADPRSADAIDRSSP